MQILNIVSSPRSGGASVTVANAFLEALHKGHPDIVVDMLDVWHENLPEFDSTTIGVRDVRTLLVEHTWDDLVHASIAAALDEAEAQARDF